MTVKALREKWITFCKTFAGAYEDYPFHDENWTMMRAANKKTFAAIYERGGLLCINVKSEPMQADFWREVYPAVIPGYHMNKVHWNTILLDGSIEDAAVEEMIAHSYGLVQPKRPENRKKAGKTVDITGKGCYNSKS